MHAPNQTWRGPGDAASDCLMADEAETHVSAPQVTLANPLPQPALETSAGKGYLGKLANSPRIYTSSFSTVGVDTVNRLLLACCIIWHRPRKTAG